MPKSLSEKRTVWSENTLEERLLNHKRWTKKKNQKFKFTSSKIQQTIRKTFKKNDNSESDPLPKPENKNEWMCNIISTAFITTEHQKMM